LPEFRAVGPIHEQVHSLGTELLKLARSGQGDLALERLPDLYELRNRLLHQLEHLIQKVADQADDLLRPG